MMAGLQVPVIPFLDGAGSTGAGAFWQIFSIGSKIGDSAAMTVTLRKAVEVQLPSEGVKV
jgi:hypothetical protein